MAAADELVRFVAAGRGGEPRALRVLRLSWVEAHVVLPFTLVQSGLAARLFGTPMVPVEVTLACSGSDALALCLGTIVAYPARWRMRLAGAGCGVALIVGLNTLRLGSLGRVAASPPWFNVLHLYVWPAVLTLAIAGYVLTWMRLADRRQTLRPSAGQHAPTPHLRPRGAAPSPRSSSHHRLPAAVLRAALPSSSAVSVPATFFAQSAAVSSPAGVTAHAALSALDAAGGFVVTQACITTPLNPGVSAAVCPIFAHLAEGVWAARHSAALRRPGHPAPSRRVPEQ